MPPQNIIEKVVREFEEKRETEEFDVTDFGQMSDFLRSAITTVLLEARKQIGEERAVKPAEHPGNCVGCKQNRAFNSAISRSQEVIDALIGKK
jgi:hypothetical protein